MSFAAQVRTTSSNDRARDRRSAATKIPARTHRQQSLASAMIALNPARGRSVQRACGCGAGEMLEEDAMRAMVQPSLSISQPGDASEVEADRTADEIMRMPDLVVAGPQISRMGDATVHRSCAACSATRSDLSAIVARAVSGTGRALDADTRGFMESRFGYDFNDVRIHTGSRVAESARALQAQAYTVGSDIVFAAGRYAPADQFRPPTHRPRTRAHRPARRQPRREERVWGFTAKVAPVGDVASSGLLGKEQKGLRRLVHSSDFGQSRHLPMVGNNYVWLRVLRKSQQQSGRGYSFGTPGTADRGGNRTRCGSVGSPYRMHRKRRMRSGSDHRCGRICGRRIDHRLPAQPRDHGYRRRRIGRFSRHERHRRGISCGVEITSCTGCVFRRLKSPNPMPGAGEPVTGVQARWTDKPPSLARRPTMPPACRRRYNFFSSPLIASFSSASSAYMRLSRLFSDSSSLTRTSSETSSPPYFAFHLMGWTAPTH